MAEGQPPYSKVLVDKFISGKLRPHQVEGVSCRGLGAREGAAELLPPVRCCDGRVGGA